MRHKQVLHTESFCHHRKQAKSAIESALEGITVHIEKKAESAGNLNAYVYLTMDAQLNI